MPENWDIQPQEVFSSWRDDFDDDTAENEGYDADELDDDELDTVWSYGTL